MGDHIEKGKESLYTLRLVKHICEAGNAYALQGNCDTLWEDLKAGLYGVDLVEYMDWRKQSLLCDMCQELGLDPHLYPPDEVRSRLENAYRELFAWLAVPGWLPSLLLGAAGGCGDGDCARGVWGAAPPGGRDLRRRHGGVSASLR